MHKTLCIPNYTKATNGKVAIVTPFDRQLLIDWYEFIQNMIKLRRDTISRMRNTTEFKYSKRLNLLDNENHNMVVEAEYQHNMNTMKYCLLNKLDLHCRQFGEGNNSPMVNMQYNLLRIQFTSIITDDLTYEACDTAFGVMLTVAESYVSLQACVMFQYVLDDLIPVAAVVDIVLQLILV